jgi:hypothetical protein
MSSLLLLMVSKGLRLRFSEAMKRQTCEQRRRQSGHQSLVIGQTQHRAKQYIGSFAINADGNEQRAKESSVRSLE